MHKIYFIYFRINSLQLPFRDEIFHDSVTSHFADMADQSLEVGIELLLDNILAELNHPYSSVGVSVSCSDLHSLDTTVRELNKVCS